MKKTLEHLFLSKIFLAEALTYVICPPVPTGMYPCDAERKNEANLIKTNYPN